MDAVKFMRLSEEFAGDDVLTKALEAFDQQLTVETATKLYKFVVKTYGRDDASEVSKKFWVPVSHYLISNGVSKSELSQIRRPTPIYGEPGFKSILDEMYLEGHDVPEHLLSSTTKRRNQFVEK
jgi:hypothetical protein